MDGRTVVNVWEDHFDDLGMDDPVGSSWPSVETRLLQKNHSFDAPVGDNEVYDEVHVEDRRGWGLSRKICALLWLEHKDDEVVVSLSRHVVENSGTMAFLSLVSMWSLMALSVVLRGADAAVYWSVIKNASKVDPLLLRFWHASVVCLLVSVVAAIYTARNGLPPLKEQRFDIYTGCRLLVAGIGYTLWNVAQEWSLKHTSFSHASAIHNSHSILLVALKFALHESMALRKRIGVIVIFCASILLSWSDETYVLSCMQAIMPSPTVEGDIGAFVGALGALCFLWQAHTVLSRMSLGVFFFWHSWAVALSLLVILLGTGRNLDVSCDPRIGLFGWACLDRLPELADVFRILEMVGDLGYMLGLQHFSPLVVSVTMNLELIVTVAFTMVTIPPVVVIVGTLGVSFGIAMVYQDYHHHTTRNVSISISCLKEKPRNKTSYGSIGMYRTG